jgi:hypothetical protein
VRQGLQQSGPGTAKPSKNIHITRDDLILNFFAILLLYIAIVFPFILVFGTIIMLQANVQTIDTTALLRAVIFITPFIAIGILLLWFAKGVLQRRFRLSIVAACFWAIISLFLGVAAYVHGKDIFIVMAAISSIYGLLVIATIRRYNPWKT